MRARRGIDAQAALGGGGTDVAVVRMEMTCGTNAGGLALQGLPVNVGAVIDTQDVDPRRLVVDPVQQPVGSAASAERAS